MISIVMPVKNAQPYLIECLDSILNQSYTNWELIAINDHSSDDSFTILQSYSESDPRIRTFQNDGQGIIPALQKAYSKTSGQFITRMDADDIMPKDKLKLFRAQLTLFPESVTTGKIKYIGENLREGYQKYEQWMNALVDRNSYFEEIYRECVIPSPAWMMSRKLFDEIGGFNHNTYPEDYDLTLRMYKAKIPIKPVDDLVHIWRDYQERTSRNDPHYAFNAFEVLKTKYFLEIDYDPNKILVIWGGGKKGKNIAILLQSHQIDFKWACNNPKKIGQDIYNIEMEDIETIFDHELQYQSIIAVANPDEQIEIKKQLSQMPNVSAYWFC